MTLRPKKMRPNWVIAAGGTVLGIALAGGALLTNALAVHGTPYPFELDGDVANNTSDSLDDWQNVFDLDATHTTPNPTGAEVFIRDLPVGNGGKETQYNAGKDTLDLSAWTRKSVSAVTPDKDNITDAFAKQYMVDIGGGVMHRVVYFGADRLANNGDAALGFWFFQQHVDQTGTSGFSPVHTRHTATQRGDILVQADFVSGGTNSQIHIYEWYGTGGNVGGSLQLIGMGSANGNTVCLVGDAACATTNEAVVNSFWPYAPKFGVANRFPTESFFEGGIDLTALVGDICFNSFLANTRTSHSETADLKDLALGDFNTCGSIDLVRKECQAQGTGADLVSPKYDASTELYTTKHTLTIRNDGMGSNVFDIGVRDDAVGGDNICRIVFIGSNNNGATGITTIPTGGLFFTNNTSFIKVADSLAAGEDKQMIVTLLCTSPTNPFANSASIRAGQVPGGTTLTDNYNEATVPADTSACIFTHASGLELTKSCPKAAVVLDGTNGYKPKVCVDITLKNTGDSNIDITSFSDQYGADTTDTKDLLSKVPGATHTIAPGATVDNISDCYTPQAPDSSQTDPDMVAYTDTVSATGHPHSAAAGVTVDATDKSATCLLCPGAGN
jgi:hypothetical protein